MQKEDSMDQFKKKNREGAISSFYLDFLLIAVGSGRYPNNIL